MGREIVCHQWLIDAELLRALATVIKDEKGAMIISLYFNRYGGEFDPGRTEST